MDENTAQEAAPSDVSTSVLIEDAVTERRTEDGAEGELGSAVGEDRIGNVETALLVNMPAPHFPLVPFGEFSAPVSSSKNWTDAEKLDLWRLMKLNDGTRATWDQIRDSLQELHPHDPPRKKIAVQSQYQDLQRYKRHTGSIFAVNKRKPGTGADGYSRKASDHEYDFLKFQLDYEAYELQRIAWRKANDRESDTEKPEVVSRESNDNEQFE